MDPTTKDSSAEDANRSSHRTQVILPVIQRTRIIQAKPLFLTRLTEERPSSAPSSPSFSRRVFPDSGSGGNRLTFKIGSSSQEYPNRTRHYSLSRPSPRFNYSSSSEGQAGSATLRVSISPGTVVRLTRSDQPNTHSSFGAPQVTVCRLTGQGTTQDINMSYNRQVSTPNPMAQCGQKANQRKISLEVPPRPSSASPTTPSRLFSVPPTPPRRPPAILAPVATQPDEYISGE